MPIQNDFSINYDHKAIRYIATGALTSGRYSVNQLYSYVQDTFDEGVQMDDTIPMDAQTPTEYRMINKWFLDYESTHGLSGGAIQSSGLSAEVYLLFFTPGGYTTAKETDRYLPVTGTTVSNSGVLLHFDNGLRKWWVRSPSYAWTNGSEVVSVSGGTGTGTLALTGNTGEEMQSNIYTLGTLAEPATNTKLYILQGNNVISPWWGQGHIDILVKVKESGSALDSYNLTVFAREYTKTFDHFAVNAPSGRNVVPLGTSNDGFNATASATVGAYAGITTTFYPNSVLRDLDNGNGLQPYKVEINCAVSGLSNVYEYLKYATHKNFTTDIDAGGGTVSGYTYIESSNSGAYNPLKSAPFGNYTGKFFGARGVWLANLAPVDVKNFSLIDNNGITQDPPNNVAVTVAGVVNGDSVFVTRLTGAGGTIIKNFYSLSATPLSSTKIYVTGSISGETPKSGKIRIRDVSLTTEQIYSFSAWSGGIFYVANGLSSSVAYATGDYAYVPIIDGTATATTMSNTIVQSTDIPVIARVRKKGIQPFEVEGTVGSNGVTIAAIRTADSIVS